MASFRQTVLISHNSFILTEIALMEHAVDKKNAALLLLTGFYQCFVINRICYFLPAVLRATSNDPGSW